MAPYIRSVAKAGNCSPLEGDGFELPVPRCARPADSAVLAVSPDSVVSSSSWNGPLHSIGCQGRQLLGCHRRAYGRSAPSRTKPENCCLSGAELKVRIHLPPADSPSLAGFLLPVSKTRQLPRRAGPWPSGTAGRDALGSLTPGQLRLISLSGLIPVPQCRLDEVGLAM